MFHWVGHLRGGRPATINAKIALVVLTASDYYRAQNDYTHTFLLFGNQFPSCTGHLLHRAFWQEFFCVIWAPPCSTFCKRQLHKIILLELIFQLHTHTSVTQKNCFRISLCNHFGPHSIGQNKSKNIGRNSFVWQPLDAEKP